MSILLSKSTYQSLIVMDWNHQRRSSLQCAWNRQQDNARRNLARCGYRKESAAATSVTGCTQTAPRSSTNLALSASCIHTAHSNIKKFKSSSIPKKTKKTEETNKVQENMEAQERRRRSHRRPRAPRPSKPRNRRDHGDTGVQGR